MSDLIDNSRPRAIGVLGILRRYASAKRDHAWIGIADHEAGRHYETPEWLAANRQLSAADDAVPRWLGWVAALIDWHVHRQTGFFRRTGQ